MACRYNYNSRVFFFFGLIKTSKDKRSRNGSEVKNGKTSAMKNSSRWYKMIGGIMA
jgi:hypothetical protein